jgi:AraC family transcriptional regulator of adaptative response/methylated-DNA-[protein]-cysteine methyltransferase
MNEAGFSSTARAHHAAQHFFGMPPSHVQTGASRMRIQFAITECSFGSVLAASTDRGLCAIFLGDNAASLETDLVRAFPKADLVPAPRSYRQVLSDVARLVEAPWSELSLPLDIQGTAFQCRVWEALRAIPSGTTRSYTEIAEQIGSPTAARAVARACATNALGVVVPCHRVVRANGDISGYRGGVPRKQQLLERERVHAAQQLSQAARTGRRA